MPRKFMNIVYIFFFVGKQEPNGNMVAEHVFCPISGKFRFTYTANNGQFRCDQTLSELSNCPVSNTLGVKFRHCSFADMGKHVHKYRFLYNFYRVLSAMAPSTEIFKKSPSIKVAK